MSATRIELANAIRFLAIVDTSRFQDPALNNFFGFGNETRITRDPSFYKIRYNNLNAALMLRKRMGDVLHLTAGPQFYRYWILPGENTGKILNNPGLLGLDSASVYQAKSYLGGRINLLINNLGDELIPLRGINWLTTLSHFAGLSGTISPVTTLTSDMTVHGAVTIPAKVVGIFKIGGGHIFNRSFEYFQALDLGHNNFLRGFRKNRFAGSSSLYTSIELRVRLTKVNSYVLPGDLGIFGFNELGKVWMRDQASKKWHHSVGGGLYYTMFNAVIVSAGAAYSKENVLFNISIGPRFNIVY